MTTPTPELVAEQKKLESCCRAWREAGRFAFDTEFIRDETYDAALCLLQVATDKEVVLVDPTAGIDLAPFWQLVTDPQLVKIVHSGKEDCELCLRAAGAPPRNVFDVQIAAGFLGYGYPLSLVRLVEYVLRKRLAKGQTLTDWLRRPLTDAQTQYAVEDVLHLPRIHAKLAEKLEKLKRAAWAREEFQRFEEPEFYKPPPQDRVHKLKGSKRLDGLGLIVLQRLIDWRDRWAQQKNRPTRALVRDDVLVEIARRRPKKASDLQVLRGFPQSKNPRIIQEVLEHIEEAAATPRTTWPKPHQPREETPMMRVTLDLLSAVTRVICHEENLSHELVGSSERLRELLDHELDRRREPPPLLRGWRREFIGQRLTNLLEGRSELHYSGWPENPRLQVITHAVKARKSAAGADGS